MVDIGLGEDLSFPEALIHRYGCRVSGFDPTPKSIAYVRSRGLPRLALFEVGVAAKAGEAAFYLPNDEAHVSGSLFDAPHVGQRRLLLPFVSIAEVPKLIGSEVIDLLKMDVEGAEFDIIQSEAFPATVRGTRQICVEFHHRWPGFGKQDTERAVARLAELDYSVAWVSPSNQEVLFVRDGAFEI